MINETIVNYVVSERARGVTDEAIRGALLAQGWPADDVTKAMTSGVHAPISSEPRAFSFERLFEGRLSRWPYFTTSVLFCFLLGLFMILVSMTGFTSNSSLIPYAGIGIVYIVGIPFSFSLSIRRLHDLNWSGWFMLLSFVPIVNFFFALIVLFKKGTDGANRYGLPAERRGFFRTLLNQ